MAEKFQRILYYVITAEATHCQKIFSGGKHGWKDVLNVMMHCR
jgi:hypothetical protein